MSPRPGSQEASPQLEREPALPGVFHAGRRPAERRPHASQGTLRHQPDSWGWFPAVALLAALMLCLVAAANGLSRSGLPFGEVPFWIGLIIPFGVIVFRLASPSITRTESIALVIVAGVFLYLVKVLRDPIIFSFADEFVQTFNSEEVLRTGELFQPNPLLPATPDYPGLASITAALASVTGLNAFGAGLVVIGSARVIMLLALFLLFERVTSSWRIAGLAAVAYVAAPNFLYYTAEISYESLALPLAATALWTVTCWTRERPSSGGAWAFASVVLIAAVVVTHHVTSYALVGFLVALTLVHAMTARTREPSPLLFACVALGLTVSWLVFIASKTVGYLQPVFTDAVQSTITIIANEGAGARTAFGSDEGGAAIPLWDRGTSLASLVLIAVLFPVGLYAMWRWYRRNSVLLVLAAASFAYLVVISPLRLVPEAWEVANRSSEFLFVGVALLLALAWATAHGWSDSQVFRAAVTLVAVVIFAGGVALGWRAEFRLAQTVRVAVDGRVIEPPGLAAARWSRDSLPRDDQEAFGANGGANSRLLLVYGGHPVHTGGVGGADEAIELPKLEPWQLKLLRDKEVRYVLMDRRAITDDQLAGYFFPTRISPHSWSELIPERDLSEVRCPYGEPPLRQRRSSNLRCLGVGRGTRGIGRVRGDGSVFVSGRRSRRVSSCSASLLRQCCRAHGSPRRLVDRCGYCLHALGAGGSEGSATSSV